MFGKLYENPPPTILLAVQQMLHPDTAPPDKSVWTGVDQPAFIARAKFLESQNVVGDLSTSVASADADSEDVKVQDPRYLLPLAAEQRLADDLAFLAAYEPGAGYVSATTVEAFDGEPRIRVCLAANRGVADAAGGEIRRFLGLMEWCARKGCCNYHRFCIITYTNELVSEIKPEVFKEDAFDIAIRLNRNRVLGRLCSKWGTRYHKVLLTIRWIKVLESHRAKVPAGKSEDFEAFLVDMKDLHLLVLQLEQSEKEDDNIPLIKSIAKKVYDITWADVPLLPRLIAFGFPESVFEKRDVRELLKIANYWRLCCNLEMYCRSRKYGSYFRTVDLQIVEPYFTSKDPDTQEEKYIHAEIQLIVHHELSNRELWPRAIGASKEACFLCDAFIRAHAFFRVTKSHGCTFWKWTIPDLVEYAPTTLSRFRTVLVDIDHEVAEEYEKAQQSPRQPAYPLQSSVNLHEPHLLTPAASTISSVESSGSKITSRKDGFVSHSIARLRRCGCGIF
jgi:hypothetical protein